MTNVEIQIPDGSELSTNSPTSFPAVIGTKPSRYAAAVKRPLDLGLASVGLVVLAPAMLLIAALVRVNLGRGGVIFRQQRVGRNGESFTIYKFRSMLPDRRLGTQPYIGPERRVTHKSDCDPRHTDFGRFLRSSSLDELPQLLNVIKGDMSLVGPRPELVAVAKRDGFIVHPRHMIRPGITGSFQVSPLRSHNRISAGLHLDLAYVADVRFLRDAKIMAKTVLVLVGRGR